MSADVENLNSILYFGFVYVILTAQWMLYWNEQANEKTGEGGLIAAKALCDNYGTTSQSEKNKHASRFVRRRARRGCTRLWAPRDEA